jgi:hypothetical protein
VFVVLLFYAITLSCFCGEIVVITNATCTMVYPMPAVGVTLELWGGWDRHQYSLLTSQHAALILLVLHFGKTSLEHELQFSELDEMAMAIRAGTAMTCGIQSTL